MYQGNVDSICLSIGVFISGVNEGDLLLVEEEVVCVLSCNDYYVIFGFVCYEVFDVLSFKREYRKKVQILFFLIYYLIVFEIVESLL